MGGRGGAWLGSSSHRPSPSSRSFQEGFSLPRDLCTSPSACRSATPASSPSQTLSLGVRRCLGPLTRKGARRPTEIKAPAAHSQPWGQIYGQNWPDCSEWRPELGGR